MAILLFRRRKLIFFPYESIEWTFVSTLLNQVIEENVYNTFDLIELLKKYYNGSFTETIKSIDDYSKVCFNCYYAAKLLKGKLRQIGIDAKYVSYKSIGFSSSFGDKLIKEAHISLVIPTIRNNVSYYVILDPGYRIPIPLGFYEHDTLTKIEIDHDDIWIQKNNDNFYPYCMTMQGYNRYSTSTNSYFCQEYFNCFYETLNPEEILFPISYEILNGYRMILFHEKKEKFAMLKLMILDNYLQCCDCNQDITFSFTELQCFNREELYTILKPFCIKLNQEIDNFVENPLFYVRK